VEPLNTDEKILQIIKNIILAEKNIQLIKTRLLSKNGATIINVDNKLKIIIPLQDTYSNAGVGIGRVIDTSEYVTDNITLYSDIYEIVLDQPIHFENPIILQIQYNPDEIEEINNIAVYYFNEITKKWEYVGGKVDTKNNTIIVELNHLSKYALLSDKNMIKMEDINDRWSKDIVYRLISKGVVNGVKVNDKYFYYPKRAITRQEFAKLAVGVSDDDINSIDMKNIFIDADQVSTWATEYVSTAYKNKWIQGITVKDGQKFEPNRQITRAEAAVLLGIISKEQKDITPSKFADSGEIPKWAKEYVDQLVSKKIINGYPDNTFRPNQFITREEAASMIDKFMEINELYKRLNN